MVRNITDMEEHIRELEKELGGDDQIKNITEEIDQIERKIEE